MKVEKTSPVTIICPQCGKAVKIIRFGYGYVAMCCNRVIYSDHKMPKTD